MTTALIALGIVAIVLGFVGCIVPALPGPVICYGCLWCLVPTDRPPSTAMLVAMGALVLAVTVADYVVPAMGAKKFNCTRWGTTGCFIGTVVGMFFFPLGLLLGPFGGAFVGELIAGRTDAAAVRGGIGALLGFLSGVFLKILACALMTYVFASRLVVEAG